MQVKPTGPGAKPEPPEGDAAVVARCLNGDGRAWKMLVMRYQRLVLAVARNMGLDEHSAADVFQTVFARLAQHLAQIADPSRLQAWIVTTARRESLLQRKLAGRTVSMTPAENGDDDAAEWDQADESPIAEHLLEDLQQLNQVRNALEQLEPRCRGLMALLFRDDDETLPYGEVASRLQIPVGSVGPTRSRCLDKLRRLMT